MFKSQSKFPLILTASYLLLALAAFGILFAAGEDESLAGVYVVLVAMPWTPLFTAVIELTGVNHFGLNVFLMLLAVAINASLIYMFFAWITRNKESK